jgi:hypothetical protein
VSAPQAQDRDLARLAGHLERELDAPRAADPK